MVVLVDTGVFVSAADADELRHAACSRALLDHRGELVVAAPVVAETAWLIESRLGPAAEARFVRLIIDGAVRVADLAVEDYRRCAELIERYADLGLGLVDASVITIAERPRGDHHRHPQPPRLHRGPPLPLRRLRADPVTRRPACSSFRRQSRWSGGHSGHGA